MKDYYAELEIVPDASPDVIKSAYRKKAALFHPDRNPDPSAAQRFRAAQEAYEVLSSPERRRTYDDTRRRSLIEAPLPVANEIWKSLIRKALS